MRQKSEQEMALRRLQELAFALQETVLFLDGHPQNTAAHRYYETLMNEYREKTAAYEAAYGPLTVMAPTPTAGRNARDGLWMWSMTPWPWEMTVGEIEEMSAPSPTRDEETEEGGER